jgi:mannose-6-phosphate isomerase-like protein (cupin superfamily)
MKLTKKSPEVHLKAWGREEWIYNGSEYCGKILFFNQNAKFSCHFHLLKKESWYVERGVFDLKLIDTENAEKYQMTLRKGDAIDIEIGVPHQLTCLEEGHIFEFSQPHIESDSYRIEKGDSQNAAPPARPKKRGPG